MQDAEILFANDTLYHAFSEADIGALDALWARHHPVCCIHPGWPAITGREQVLESWRRILDNPEAPRIRPHHARVLAWGPLHAVICYEELETQMLTAFNLFVEEEGAPRLVHHQAGPCAQPPPPQAPNPVQ